MKKILSLVLALAMMLCAFAPAVAEGALEGKLVILHTNDIHGRAVADAESFGYARIAMLKKNLQAQGAEVILMDAGDFSQGTPLVNLGYGKNAVEFMNVAGYDLATLGNHEFDWGSDNMEQNMANAKFAVVCANLTRAADGTLVLPANKIYETAIGKVGVFGLDTPETMTKTHPDKVKGISFAQGEELFAVAQAQVAELEAAGCDLIVCLGHLGEDDESTGNRSIDLLEKVTGIDLFIDAHSHTVIDGGEMCGETLRTSTGNYAEAIGYVVAEKVTEEEVTSIALNAGLWTIAENDEAAMALGNGLAIDEEVAAIVNTLNDAVEAELSATFAKTEVLLDGNRAPGVRTQETNLGDFAADAILWAAKQAIGEMTFTVVHFKMQTHFTAQGKTVKIIFLFAQDFIADFIRQRESFAVHDILEHLQEFRTAFFLPDFHTVNSCSILTSQYIRQGVGGHFIDIVIGFPGSCFFIHFQPLFY